MCRNLTHVLGQVTALLALLAGSCQGGDDRHTFDSNGVKISYVVAGKGEPVVLIHGLYSSALVNWQLTGVVAELAKDYQVIALDMPGHGFSDKPETDAAYGLEMVEDVVRLMDKLNVKKAHIVGYSMGGMIAAKLVATHPDRVSSVLLGGMGWLQDGTFLQKIWEGWGKDAFLSTPSQCPRSFGKLALSEAEIKGIKAPLTVLVGEKDPCKFLYVAPLEKARPDWKVITIPDADHLSCVIKPQFKEEIKKAIRN